MMVRTSPLTALAIAALFTAHAHAADKPAALTATQMLQQFNLVVSKDLYSTSHVQGRTFVGGNATAVDFVQRPNLIAASDYAGVTVLGNMTGNSDAHVDALGLYVGGSTTNVTVNKGDAYVQGSATYGGFAGNTWIGGAATNVNLNGAAHAGSLVNTNNNNKLTEKTSTMLKAEAAATSTDFGAVMKGLSNQLSTLKASADTQVTLDSTQSKVTFSGSTQNGLLVFDLTALESTIFSSKVTDWYFDLSGANTVIFNTDDKTDLSLTANFQNAETNGSKFIWNFAGATSVTMGRTFGGQVLVADGKFSNLGGANVEGGVYAQSVNEQGQIHIQTFTGVIPTAPVPEPGTYAMLLAGLGMLGLVARRRKQ